eukprot:s22_g21.t1
MLRDRRAEQICSDQSTAAQLRISGEVKTGEAGEDAADLQHAHCIRRIVAFHGTSMCPVTEPKADLLELENDGGEPFEPLPAGLDRNSPESCFMVDANSLRSANTPPRGGTVLGPASSRGLDPAKTAVAVPYHELRLVKEELREFDEQTQLDVREFRHRIAEAERELSGLLRSTAEFRKEVDDAEAKWHKHQNYKKVLMDAVQAALDSTKPSEPMEHAPHELLTDCFEKLHRLQNDMLEEDRKRKALLKESNALAEDIAELKEVKARSMTQLQSFLELRAQQRHGKLKNAFAQLLPMSPLDLDCFLNEI